MDALSTITGILSAGWTAANTDSITPVIGNVFSYKELDLRNNDYILCYEVSENWAPFSLGGTSWSDFNGVSIDVRTTYKNAAMTAVRAHLIKVKGEIVRIIKSKLANPDSDYQLLLLQRKIDLSDKNIGIGRVVIDVVLRRWGS